MLSCITDRRSIRKFKNTSISRESVEEIIRAGSLAPSSKNRQPWRFVVTSGRAKEEALEAMRRGLVREAEHPLLPGNAPSRGSAEHTRAIMAQAPVVIFIFNPLGIDLSQSLSPEERIYEICNAQSIGACIENMALAAEDMGLGSLWICDTYFAYAELMDVLRVPGELVAALALGYADEAPHARPRNALCDIIEWRA